MSTKLSCYTDTLKHVWFTICSIFSTVDI